MPHLQAFVAGKTDDALATYLPKLQADSQCGLDVRYFTQNLPSESADAESGRASWLPGAPPVLVLGAERDAVVDREGVEETAAFLGVDAVMLDLPHDVMLCEGWEAPADRVISFAKAQQRSG